MSESVQTPQSLSEEVQEILFGPRARFYGEAVPSGPRPNTIARPENLATALVRIAQEIDALKKKPRVSVTDLDAGEILRAAMAAAPRPTIEPTFFAGRDSAPQGSFTREGLEEAVAEARMIRQEPFDEKSRGNQI